MDRPEPEGPPGAQRRRPMSAPAGRVLLSGDRAAAERLRDALAVPPLPERFSDEERALVERSLSVHLFHSFAARTHPLTARALLSEVGPGQLVFDPFAGSGTVLVEAALRGAGGAGTDVGELQVRLSRFKATPMPEGMRKALVQRAAEVAEASQERVKKRVRPARTWDDPSHYEPHVYLELCGLREEIDRVALADPPLGEALLLVLSSLVIKASRQEAESSARAVRRSLGKGLVSRWLQRRAEEVARLHGYFAERVPRGTPRPVLAVADARRGAPTPPDGGADLLLTSPPYLGVYDYAAHHLRRCAWLGIDPRPQLEGEIGARRAAPGDSAQARVARHARDTEAWLVASARKLRPGAQAYIIVGDSTVGPEPLPGDEPVRRGARAAGLEVVAACAVERPGARYEHLLQLQKSRSRSS